MKRHNILLPFLFWAVRCQAQESDAAIVTAATISVAPDQKSDVATSDSGEHTAVNSKNNVPIKPDGAPPLDRGNEFVYFDHFIAQNSTMKCWSDDHISPFNLQARGTCLGGWLVLEPWITPSLFYQFLGKDEKSTATDMYSFCNVLGPTEANLQLRRHWDTWVTEDLIRELATDGKVNSLRLPVGDWMYEPYGPYVGCTDGAIEYVDKVLDWAQKYDLTILIDIHGIKDSQNGFDNSGQSLGFEWTSVLNTEPKGLVTFEHWPIRTANWMGTFNRYTASYTDINYDNIAHGLRVITKVVERHKSHPAVLGLEPLNEPWQYTPIDLLKRFYWDGYLIVKRAAPEWKYVMHDSFRMDPNLWGGFMSGCPDRALDTHIYQAWNFPASRETFYNDACQQKHAIAAMEDAFGPVIVGEWSLATDNCAMWLNGFNDNLSGYPMLPCKYVPCPDPYMGFDQPGTPVDPGKPIQGPFGTGMSGPSWGMCPVDRDWMVENKEGKGFMHAPPNAPPGLDDTDNVMRNLAQKKINTFSGIGHGFYFWNFRTELDEPQWNYLEAVRRGWIPTGHDSEQIKSQVLTACEKEDQGKYKCVAKRGMLDKNTISGVEYCISVDPETGNPAGIKYYQNMTGDELANAADDVFDGFWSKHRLDGATCDFGGVAQLRELNYTYVPPPNDNDWYSYDNMPKGVKIGITSISILLGFMAVFGLCMMKIGGGMREATLRSAGAIRKSYAALGEAITSRVSRGRLDDQNNDGW